MKTIALDLDESSAVIVQLPPRGGEATRFRSGVEWRGNRHGRPRKPPLPPPPKTVKELAREKSIEAIELLVRVMNDPGASNRDRITAANAILDRAFGKPTVEVATIELSNLEAMSEEELRIYVVSGILPEGI